MFKSILSGALIAGLSLGAASSASAQSARIVEVNRVTPLYSGPSHGFNVVANIPGRNSVVLNGCLSDYAWCEVSYRNTRGWVDADDLRYMRNNQPYTIYSSRNWLSYPVLTFSLGNYWNSNYRGQVWYRDINRYNSYDWRQHNNRWDNRPNPGHRPPPHSGRPDWRPGRDDNRPRPPYVQPNQQPNREWKSDHRLTSPNENKRWERNDRPRPPEPKREGRDNRPSEREREK